MRRLTCFALLCAAVACGGCSLFQDEAAPGTAAAGPTGAPTSIAGAPRAATATGTTPAPPSYPIAPAARSPVAPPPPPMPAEPEVPEWTAPAAPPVPEPAPVDPGAGSGCGKG